MFGFLYITVSMTADRTLKQFLSFQIISRTTGDSETHFGKHCPGCRSFRYAGLYLTSQHEDTCRVNNESVTVNNVKYYVELHAAIFNAP